MKPGGVGYKSDIDPINDLTNSTIDNAVIMHAVKVNYTFNDSFHGKPNYGGGPIIGADFGSSRYRPANFDLRNQHFNAI